MSTELPDIGLNLCDMDGAEAAQVLNRRIYDPSLPIKIGDEALTNLVSIQHREDDGVLRISYTGADDLLHSFTFSVEPVKPFSETAVDASGESVCRDC